MGWVVNATPWTLYPQGRRPDTRYKGAAYAQGPVWTGAENLAFTGIRFPGRPGLSEIILLFNFVNFLVAYGLCQY